MKIFNVHAFFFSIKPEEKYDGRQHFPSEGNKNQSTSRTTLQITSNIKLGSSDTKSVILNENIFMSMPFFKQELTN